MADIYIDCEWIGGDYLTILGAYSYGQNRFQLYSNTLTKNRLSRFLNLCSEYSGKSDTFLFCHGPDIGKIKSYFGIDLKAKYYCINTITAVRTYTKLKDVSLSHLETYFRIDRNYVLSLQEMPTLWYSPNARDRKRVLNYNWEDCINLWKVVMQLKQKYHVTPGDLKKIAMST